MQSALTRNLIRPNYALITPDGCVPSQLPGWTGCTPCVQISSAMGAGLVQILISMENGGHGTGEMFGWEMFLYLLAGEITLHQASLGPGSFAYLPPGSSYDLHSHRADTRLLLFRKRYEPLAGTTAPDFFTGQEREIPETPFLGDPHARLQTLIPDTPGADLAINLFTYDPGATLPFVETHVMEHGLYFLDGGGIYRLGDDWHPVRAGDALWIAPYCPQWFIAAGPGPARYIYYKNIHRLPL